MEKHYYVYIMTNSRNTVLYVGVTNNIARRVGEHKNGAVDGFTKKYKTEKCVYVEEYSEIYDALSREKQLKGWSRDKKFGLINAVNPELKDYFEKE